MSGSAGTAGELVPYFEPGTRLKPKVLATDGGVDVIEGFLETGWYDSDLDFDCYFVADEAGVERCFPLAFDTFSTFADSSCTRHVLPIVGTGSCDRLRYQYLVSKDPTDEGCGYHGLHVAAELPLSTPLFSASNGGCEPRDPPAGLGHVWELEAVPAETFVAMHRVRSSREADLDAYVREGDDGSWQVIGFFDRARSAPCLEPSLDLSPASKCIPSFASFGGLFADAACEVRVSEIAVRACESETPTAIIEARIDTSVCPRLRPYDLYEIDGVRETQPYNLDASGACVPNGTEPMESYVQGAPIDPNSLPTLETLIVGTGPVKARFSGSAGVPFLPFKGQDGPLVGAASGAACTPYELADGTLRCVPTSFVIGEPNYLFYESSSCSGARVLLWQPNPSCLTEAPLPRGIVMFGAVTECTAEPILTETIAIVGESNAETIYSTNATTGTCDAVTDRAPTSRLLVLGDALDPSEIFEEVERTIRE